MKFIRVSAKEEVNIDYLFEVVENFIIEKTIEKRSNSQNPKQITYY
jgi:translation initiation factor 2 gamma subunit (eIF-2gamma)